MSDSRDREKARELAETAVPSGSAALVLSWPREGFWSFRELTNEVGVSDETRALARNVVAAVALAAMQHAYEEAAASIRSAPNDGPITGNSIRFDDREILARALDSRARELKEGR